MLIGDFLVDGTESGRSETHYRHRRQLGGAKDIAEGDHDGPMHLDAGRFAISIWLHDYSHPLVHAMAGGRGGHKALRERTLRGQPVSAGKSIRPDVIAIKLSPAFQTLNGSKL